MLQLYEDLNKCDFYQREAFAKKYIKRAYIKNLTQNQTYLRKKIIEGLISYRSKSIFEIGMHSQINEALILIEKKFYRKAKKIFDQCFEKALVVEDYVTCYSLICNMFKNINNITYFRLSKKEINDLRNKRSFYLTQLCRMETYAELNEIYYNIKGSKKQSNAYNEKLKKLMY